MNNIQKQIDENTSDGYHTFKELYEHRHMLFIALMHMMPGLSWRSKLHADGTSFHGWFIAGISLPKGDITYHLPNELWTLIDGSNIKVLPNAPEWDGHTANDVIERLRDFNKNGI
jgi:hypothetical protein